MEDEDGTDEEELEEATELEAEDDWEEDSELEAGDEREEEEGELEVEDERTEEVSEESFESESDCPGLTQAVRQRAAPRRRSEKGILFFITHKHIKLGFVFLHKKEKGMKLKY